MGGEGKGKEGGDRREGEGKGGGGEGRGKLRPPFLKFLDPPLDSDPHFSLDNIHRQITRLIVSRV